MSIWRKKDPAALQMGVDHPVTLKKTLGAMDLILLGIGAIIGAGLFSITGIAAAQHAGPAILISFAIAALGSGFAALCYSEMATMIPVSGSAYTYAYATLGELIAWMIGWDLILEYAVGAATVSISWSAYAVSLLHHLNIQLPPQLLASPWQPVLLPDGSHVYGYINLPAAFIVILISSVLVLGIRQSTLTNAVIVVIKVVIVIVFIAVGVNYIHPENYHPFIPSNTGHFGEYGWSGIMRAAGIVFFAYIGFDAVSTAAQETKNPQRNLPIGIIGSLIICTVLYMLFAAVMTGLVNYKDLNVAAPVALAIDQTPYWWLNGLVKLGILAGFTSVILVMLLGQSRIFFSMSKDGLLPKIFSDIHPTFQTPWKSNLLLMVFVSLFGAFAPLKLVGEMTSIGTLLAFVIVCIAVWVMRKTHPQVQRSFKVPFVPLVPILGIMTCVAMMFSLGLSNWLRLIGWMAIGMIIYLGYSRRYSHEGKR